MFGRLFSDMSTGRISIKPLFLLVTARNINSNFKKGIQQIPVTAG